MTFGGLGITAAATTTHRPTAETPKSRSDGSKGCDVSTIAIESATAISKNMPKRSSVRDVTTLYCRSATSPAAIRIAIKTTSLVTASSKIGAIRGWISR